MTIVTEHAALPAPAEAHQALLPVVIPGPYDTPGRQAQTEFPAFVPANAVEPQSVPASHPTEQSTELMEEAANLNHLLGRADAGGGLRQYAGYLLDALSIDPNNEKSRRELYALKFNLDRSARRAESVVQRPLSATDREAAERTLVIARKNNDEQAIALLEQALSVGQEAAQTNDPASSVGQTATRVYVGRHFAKE